MFNEYAQDTSMFGEEHAICRSWICVSYLPAANAEQEAHDIALLLLLQLLEILVGTHLFAVLATAFCSNFSSKVWCSREARSKCHCVAIFHHDIQCPSPDLLLVVAYLDVGVLAGGAGCFVASCLVVVLEVEVLQ